MILLARIKFLEKVIMKTNFYQMLPLCQEFLVSMSLALFYLIITTIPGGDTIISNCKKFVQCLDTIYKKS